LPTLTPEALQSVLGDQIDDRTRTLLTLLGAGDEEKVEQPETELLNSMTPERAERTRRMRRRYEEMAAEIEELRFRNEALAAALGACPNCWGETPACRQCRGQGAAGAYPVDPELYAAVVEPVVRGQLSGDEPNHDPKGDTDA
jgi:hypothetical protein